MNQELNCEFYFGNQVDSPILKMDVSKLPGYKKTIVLFILVIDKMTIVSLVKGICKTDGQFEHIEN